MPPKTDNLIARQEYIIQRLQETGGVAIDELCTTTGASHDPIRRDLEDLESRSLLRRTRGGAVPIGPLFYEPFRNDSSFQDKVKSFAEEKRRIALTTVSDRIAQAVVKGYLEPELEKHFHPPQPWLVRPEGWQHPAASLARNCALPVR